MSWHWHDWSAWSDTYTHTGYANLYQAKSCRKCNRIKERML